MPRVQKVQRQSESLSKSSSPGSFLQLVSDPEVHLAHSLKICLTERRDQFDSIHSYAALNVLCLLTYII